MHFGKICILQEYAFWENMHFGEVCILQKYAFLEKCISGEGMDFAEICVLQGYASQKLGKSAIWEKVNS